MESLSDFKLIEQGVFVNHSFKHSAMALLCLASISFLVTGCSNKTNAYLTDSSASQNLVLPYHHATGPLDNQYPLPAQSGQGDAQPSLVPPGFGVSNNQNVKE
jgi:hypothetical protein